MWFKNLILYRFTQAFDLKPEELEDKLKQKRFKSCSSQDMSTYGWVPPLNKHSDMLTHSANGFVMVTARKEEKILPASVVRDAWKKKLNTSSRNRTDRFSPKRKKP